MGLNQRDFAELAEATLDRQHRYETGKHQPNAEYLARLAGHGVDILYLLTGDRNESAPLDREVSDLISDFEMLPPPLKRIAGAVVRTMREEAETTAAGEASPTVHTKQLAYHAGEGR